MAGKSSTANDHEERTTAAPKKAMHITALIDFVCAVHLTSYVRTEWEARGGVMLVSRAEGMKTSVLSVLEHYHPSALVMSDITTKGLSRIKDDVAGGMTNSLVFLDLQKLYERHAATASNLEGALRALSDEGFSSLAFESQEIAKLKARACVIGALTPRLAEVRSEAWKDNGFLRRYIWLTYRLANPQKLYEAVVEHRRLDIGKGVIPVPRSGSIPYTVTHPEALELRKIFRYQHGVIPLQIGMKAFAVLKWHYSPQSEKAMDLMRSLEPLLGREGGIVDIE